MPARSAYDRKADHYREETREYYRAHRADRLAYAKRYREKHKKELSAKRKKYRDEYREEINARHRAYRATHLEQRRAAARDYARAHPRRARNYQLWYRHGLTVADYRALRRQQHGCCAICGKKRWRLVVDHNHKTGKIRGLLCNSCNSLLGFARDSTANLTAAVRYLRTLT